MSTNSTHQPPVYREVHTQVELEAALSAEGVVPVCVGSGFFLIPASSGSATVRAYDSATVEAYDSATVEASGSATVRAYDSATVRAYDSATVRAYDSATVEASKYVAIHQHGTDVQIVGGVVIHVPDWNTADITDWADYAGLTQDSDGTLTVYKAVSTDLVSAHHMRYPIGETVTAPDWDETRSCGGGLHFSQTPHHARRYVYDGRDHARFLAVQIDVGEAVVLGHDKVKARSCVVLHEVDIDGQPLPIETPADGGAQ